MREAKFRVVPAVTPDDRAAALAVRSKVFIEELGYVIPDTASGQPSAGLADPGDERAFILVGYDGDTAAGTMAVDWWADGELPPSRVANFHLDEFAEAFGRRAIFFIRKAAVLPRYRRSALFLMLVQKVSQYIYEHPEARFGFLETSPYRVRLYERLGFRRYAPHFVYEHGGAIAVRVCMVVDDLEHLARMRSPVLAVARAFGRPQQPDAWRFFEERWGGHDGISAVEELEAAASDPDDEPGHALSLAQAALFANLEQAQLDRLLEGCRTVRYRAGEVLIADGSPETDLYLLLRGYVDVTRNHAGRKVAVATYGPGDLFGEMSMLLGTGRTGTVSALTDVEALAIPERVFLVASDGGAAAQINLNLARILARRLRITGGLITVPPPL